MQHIFQDAEVRKTNAGISDAFAINPFNRFSRPSENKSYVSSRLH